MKLVYFAYLCVAVTAFGKSSHSINLMWINSKLKKDQELVCPADKPCVEKAFEWAKKNPDAEVNLWIDSATTSAKQVKKTRKLIEAKNTEDMAPIRLKDIRNLSGMQSLLDVYSDSRVPVYFRADLARAIVLHDKASEGENDNVVYADIDMPAQTQEKLFDSETQEKLDRYGMVMAKYNDGFENGFQIVRGKNTDVLHAMKHALIDVNAQRANNAREGKFYTVNNRQPNGPFEPLAEAVFSSYQDMFAYLYHRKGLGKMRVEYYGKDSEVYDENKHGLKPFGLSSVANRYIEFTANPGYEELKGTGFFRVNVPTKEVNFPNVSHNYTKDIQ